MSNISLQEEALLELFSSGSWFMFPKKFLQITSPTGALLLAYFLNECKRDTDKWIKAPHKDTCEFLGISRQAETKHINKLAEDGFIKVERRKIGAHRYVQVDLKAICKAIWADVNKSLHQDVTKSLHLLSRISPSIEGEDTQKKEEATAGAVDSQNRGPVFSDEERMFFKEIQQDSPDDYDISCCERLKLAVTKQKRTAKWKNTSQAKEIAKLRRQINDPELFERVFNWYCENFKHRRTMKLPSATSPAQFGKQWDWILDRYEKLSPPQEVVLTKEQSKTLEQLQRLNWPKGSVEQLPQLVKVSTENWNQYRDAVDYVREDLEAASIRHRKKHNRRSSKVEEPYLFAANMQGVSMAHPNFILRWFERVFKSIANWEEWNGDLSSHCFHIEHPSFTKLGKQWAEQRGQDADNWNNFITLIQEKLE